MVLSRITTYQKITIIRSRKPQLHNINDELNWVGMSLGLFNIRDKDKSCFRIFIELLKAVKKRQILTSDELADHLSLTRGTVIHHIKKLIEAGLVVSQDKGYILRVDNLGVLIDEVQKDIQRTCNDLKEVANEIDRALGLD